MLIIKRRSLSSGPMPWHISIMKSVTSLQRSQGMGYISTFSIVQFWKLLRSIQCLPKIESKKYILYFHPSSIHYISFRSRIKDYNIKNRNIKYARPETAFVTQEFVKTCLYLHMKDISRESLTRSLKKKRFMKVEKNIFFQIGITYVEYISGVIGHT